MKTYKSTAGFPRRNTTALLAGAVCLTLSGLNQASAAAHILNNGPGDASVSVGVDGYGAFGSSIGANASNAIYDPVGAIGPAGTTFESGVAIRFGGAGGYSFLTSGDIGGSGNLANPAVIGNATMASSAFAFGGLSFSLLQTLAPLFDGPNQVGSVLSQQYTILNQSTAAPSLSFDLIRYLDGDLTFDGSIADGGGRVFSGPTEVLFETDTAAGTATSTTFVGITGEGGTIPGTGRFEVDSFSGLRGRIVSGTALDDTITGDGGDADSFIDVGSGYDVTLALRNSFTLQSGASAVYTTRTIFGSGAPRDVPPPTGRVPDAGATLGMLGLGFAALVGAQRRILR